MTTTAVTPGARPLVRHFVEMVLAMIVGVLVLGPLWPVPATLAVRADVASFVMATNMSVAVAVWMWHRGHSNAAIGEMTAAMYAPFLLFLIPWWAGLLAGEVVLIGAHVLMLPAMVLAMLRRTTEYGATPHVDADRRGTVARVLARWPSVLGLLATVDNLVDPRPVPVYAMMILPVGYLAIGAIRRTLRPRPVLLAQLGQLLGYLLLLGAAVLAGPQWSQYLVAAGWIFHAGWDLWHHRRNLVVPRPLAEWCAVVDLIIGISVILVAATM
ncbi:hypothetical protein [Asanoa siamensis]|uniref:LexA-binding, inner membrane-associated hydrolase n=1 Tax=Asanoa siamensis TaxID=926357 RepID=A0ABQ4CPT4_9ACTN|nr:hypothetical protein [Asanoa siamensis]GIF73305.1 hypothetical protein Asi02nite_28230 [Asanoa siamensis]